MADKHQEISQHVKDLLYLGGKILFTWFVTSVSLFLAFKNQVTYFFLNPISHLISGLNFHAPMDALKFYMKMFAISGLMVSLPVIVILIWNYIKPALRDKETTFIGYYLSATVFLITFAVIYGYKFLVPVSLRFLVGITVDGVKYNLDAYQYLGFVIMLLFMLIIAFQIPILIYGMVRSSLIPASVFWNHRKEILVAEIAAVTLFSPTGDLFSLILFVAPTYGMIELAVWLANYGLVRAENQAIEDERDTVYANISSDGKYLLLDDKLTDNIEELTSWDDKK